MKLRSNKLEFTFDVLIESLSDVPRLQGSIQCKLRLLAKRFKDDNKIITAPVKIANHQAQFNSHHVFVVQMSTNSKAVLKRQMLHVSVRLIDSANIQKKLGYSDVNLAELTPGENTRKPLLTGYRSNKKERQDNSRIILRINMSLTRGDPMSFMSAGAEYNSYNASRNVIKDILNPNPNPHMEPSTLHSQLTPSDAGGGNHSRNPSAQIDPANSYTMSDHWHLSTNCAHSRNASQENSNIANININSSSGSFISSHAVANAAGSPTMTRSILMVNRNSTISESTANTTTMIDVSGGSSLHVAAAEIDSSRLGAKRLADDWDSLATSRPDNQALVNSLFENFTVAE